jgi:hypothetical protein
MGDTRETAAEALPMYSVEVINNMSKHREKSKQGLLI